MSKDSQTTRSASTPFTTPDPQLAVGTHHAGFTVTSVERLHELGGMAYVLRHDASGARALWIAVPDNNKSFSIAFKTPPTDSTGVFHILEHSVLCGSDRFPVKEPFVNLLKTSMQTFLNALTFLDKTMYPVASTNVQDLENLMDVYLDAVLHPAIYHRKRIFEQEGWHLEADEEGRLSYNGVVYNEMQGALSNPDDVLVDSLSAQLFPDTAYGFESGGDPKVIPSLTYEKFLDTHARHYNLANSYTILYGDLDIDRELAFIDKRFQGATDRGAGAPNPLVLQTPVTPTPKTVTMPTTPDNAAVGLAYVLGTAADRERVLATSILLDALAGSNDAPLKRVILDSGLGNDFYATLMDSTLQPTIVFELKGAKPGVAQKFRDLVEKTCHNLVTSGIERQRLVASLSQAEFNLREGDWGSYGDGVALSMMSLASWLYDDDRPVDYLHFQNALDHMKDQLDTGYFELLLDELVCRSQHNALVDLVPTETVGTEHFVSETVGTEHSVSETKGTEQPGTTPVAAGSVPNVSETKDSVPNVSLEEVRAEVEALRAEQEAPDAPEDLAKLPHLTRADITDAPNETPLEQVEAPLPCLYHDLPTHRIAYVYHYFDLRRLTADDLPYLGILSELLGSLNTSEHTASELDMLLEEKLGTFNAYTVTFGRDDDPLYADPKFVVSASALSENIDALAALPSEVWGKTLFDDTDRIYELLVQRRINQQQNFINAGHQAALSRVATHYSNASVVPDRIGGVDAYLWLSDLLGHWDERKDALAGRLASLAKSIFTADELTTSFTGSREDLIRFWELGGSLGLTKAGDEVARHRLELGVPQQGREAFVIPSSISYVAEGAPRAAQDKTSLGSWQVAGRILSLDYLWDEVRVKGGAYGVGFTYSTTGSRSFWSFRDPSVDDTLDRYEGAASWLRDWKPSADELDGYVVSSVAGIDAPLKPRQIARKQDLAFFRGRPANWQQIVRQQVLDFDASDLVAKGAVLSDLPETASVCVFGSREAIASSKALEGVEPIELA